MSRIHLFLAASLSLALPLRAQQNAELGGAELPQGVTSESAGQGLPAGGASLLGGDPLAALRLTDKAGQPTPKATLEMVDVAGQPFARALRVRVTARIEKDELVLSAPTQAAFARADTLFAQFFLRTVEGPTEEIEVRENIQPTAKFALDRGSWAYYVHGRKAGREWKRHAMPRLALRGYGAAAGRFVLYLGPLGAPATFEIGGLQVLNYEKRRFPHQLPNPGWSKAYEGREPNAAWRKEAQERIEKNRKAGLQVLVTDGAGKPLPGARVQVKMLRHAFRFGVAVSEPLLIDQAETPDGRKYRELIPKYFNHAVLEGGHKWRTWAGGAKNQARARSTVDWLRGAGLSVRGHVLVWPGGTNTPSSLIPSYKEAVAARGEAAAKDELRKKIRSHIAEIAGAFKGQLTDWDAINETTNNKALMEILGEEAMADWFQAAHEVDPTVPLVFNEFNVFQGKNRSNFERHVRLLKEKGAPIGGLGEQAHGEAMSIPHVLKTMDELWAEFKLPLKITEFDIVTYDEAYQADWTRDLLTAAFSHPSVDAFVMWGFWDGSHWLGDAPMFYPDWSLKPSGQAWIDLTQKQWWTNLQGTSDARGKYLGRGFLGDYEVTATSGGKSRTVKMSLAKEGGVVTLALE